TSDTFHFYRQSCFFNGRTGIGYHLRMQVEHLFHIAILFTHFELKPRMRIYAYRFFHKCAKKISFLFKSGCFKITDDKFNGSFFSDAVYSNRMYKSTTTFGTFRREPRSEEHTSE